jgi:hypothetical protein
MDRFEQQQMRENIIRSRDRTLRKQLLAALFELRASPSGWTSATTLRDGVIGIDLDNAEQEQDDYWIGLLRDLHIKGLIEERQKPRKRGETFSLKHLEYRLLSPGLSLHLESAPPDPDIDDGRIIR